MLAMMGAHVPRDRADPRDRRHLLRAAARTSASAGSSRSRCRRCSSSPCSSSVAWCRCSAATRSKLDNVNRIMREQLTGVRVVRAFVREPIEEERFRGANTDIMVVGRKVGSLFVLLFPLFMLVLNVTVVAVVWFGAFEVNDGDVEIGTLFAFMQYVMLILTGVLMASFMTIMIPRAAVSAERIGEVLDSERTLVRPENPVHEFPAPGTVAVRRRRVQPTPAPSSPCSRASRSARGQGRDGRDRRLHRRRQDHAHLAHPPPVRRHRRRGRGRRRRRARGRPREALGHDRPGAAASVPLHRHDRIEPAVRARRGDRRRPLARARDRPGPRLRRGDGGRARTRASRRAARTSRAGSASVSPSPGPSCTDPTSSCSTTRSRRSTSRPTRDSGRRSGVSCPR